MSEIAYRWAIVAHSWYEDPETAAVLAVALAEDTITGFERFRNELWPECPIVDVATWEIVSPGKEASGA